jgi:hypothetical protein
LSLRAPSLSREWRSNDVDEKHMSRRIRILSGIIILALSLSLLIWGFAPTHKEIRVQPISPSELQLPTLESFLPSIEVVL